MAQTEENRNGNDWRKPMAWKNTKKKTV
jgi:hypothetical protein